MVQEMTKNFLPFVFKTKLENVTNHYPTQFRMLHLLTLMSCRSCFLELYSEAKGSEHQKSQKEEESTSCLVLPSWLYVGPFKVLGILK